MMRLFLLIIILFFPQTLWAANYEKPEHVVVVIEENKSFRDIIGNKDAPFINQLAKEGALMTESYAIAHPSLPNYLALFSGSTHGVTDDDCTYKLMGNNLALSLQEKALTFGIYLESMPVSGFDECRHGAYRKKHNPPGYFDDLPANTSRPLNEFPQNYILLPTVAFVIPDLQHDMHDGTVAQADAWLSENLGPYIAWAKTHHSLLILTWDEDDNSNQNHIPTIFAGAGIKPGKYDQHINHYSVLKTLTKFYGVSSPNKSKDAQPVAGIWTQ